MREDKEIANEISELITLTNRVKELDNERSLLSKKVIDHMKNLSIKNFNIVINTIPYIVERCNSVKYSEADPNKVRSLLGKTGEKYIREYVVPELRAELPPRLVDQIYKIEKETEYVRVRIFKEQNDTVKV